MTDSTSLDALAGSSGTAAPPGRHVATEDRLYLVDKHTTVLVHEGHRIPLVLLEVEHVPAVLEDGVYVPQKGGRK